MEKEEELVGSRFDELVITFNHRVDSLDAEVQERMPTEFGVSSEAPRLEDRLSSEHRFYFQERAQHQGGLIFVGGASLVLPKFAIGGSIRKRFASQAKEAFEGTAGRIGYECFIVRLDRSKTDMRRRLENRLDYSVDAARNGLKEGFRLRQRNKVERDIELGGLISAQKKILSVRSRLESISAEMLASSQYGASSPKSRRQ